MKILQMNLLAFGPFTNTILDLGDGDEGLHIIYGPNEAGKSSALRALRQMLYGIPVRSADDFRHPYAKLRIGATLRMSNGTRLEFIRRKGKSNIIRAGDDQTVLDETILSGFLGGVDADLFDTMFGIDHADLVSGGKEIIKGGGSLGPALFAAGAGIGGLREIQSALQAKADVMFRPSGQKPQINEAIAALKKSRKALRDAQLPGRTWLLHDQALREAVETKKAVEKNLSLKERDQHRLNRIREALPAIARRKELLEDLQIYASAIRLPEDFSEKRREQVTELRVAENKFDQAHLNIEEIMDAMGKLEISGSLLQNADLSEALYQELGSHRKAARDRVQLTTLRDVYWREAKEILIGLQDGLTLEDAEKLRIKKSDTVKIKELGARYERLMTQREGALEEIPKITHHIDLLENRLKKLEAPRPAENLAHILEQATKYAALEEHWHSEHLKIKNILQSLEIALKKQTLWSGSAEALERLPVPSLETIDMLADQINAAERNVADCRSEIKNLQDTITEIERQIDVLHLEQEVPTEEELQTARQKRNQGWLLVRAMLAEEPVSDDKIGDFIKLFQPCGTLAEAYAFSVQQADEVADRLRREADRVATNAKLHADKFNREKQIGLLKANFDAAVTALTAIEDQWRALWRPADIFPRSPKEMRGWVQDQQTLAAKFAEIRERKAKADVLKTNIDGQYNGIKRCFRTLSEAPAEAGESLGDLIKRGRGVIEKQEALSRQRENLRNEKEQREKDLSEATSRVKDIEMELSQWHQQWGQAVDPLGLDANALPAQAGAVMEDLKNLFDKLKDAGILDKRINGIDWDAEEFTQKVAGLVEQVAKDLAGQPFEQAVAELNARLTRARGAQSQHLTLEKQRQQEEARVKQATQTISAIQVQLNGMCLEAGCTSFKDLPEAEKRSEQRRQIESELNSLNEQLRKLSAGATIDDFVTEAEEVDPDSIDAKIDRLKEEINALTQKKSELDQTIGSERTELSKMDGHARAATLAEENQLILGHLESDVEQYVRLRLASTVLHHAIERYREKNQGPVLKRSSELFAQMTLGSFEGLRVEFDEKGDPIIVGVRPGGKDIVGVEGMSDGTTDQLYLALRLASLETYLDNNEPLPFIVDDILIRFDNDRAIAVLKILAELAEKTQVIFFTHHRHLEELAEVNVDRPLLFRHSLST
jgi:uncharacterized protein YhaN